MRMTRREFLSISAAAACTLVISTGLAGCGDDTPAATFMHGVASGDPQSDKIILWTRATPLYGTDGTLTITFEVATDAAFENVIRNGSAATDADSDYTVKIDVQGLAADSVYYYRFASGTTYSPTGRTKTLPVGSLASLTMAVFTCSNYPAGYFNAYAEAAGHDAIDVAVHLGDYIYEYGMFEADGVTPGYATENAEAIGRTLPDDNAQELLTLDAYRKRYALYRSDADLAALHAAVPFIAVWDDHEIANDAYDGGAENHQSDTEGDFETRKSAALKAYFEWLPIRPAAEGDESTIYRRFDFGDLASLYMLDTRIIGRDKQLDYNDYMSVDGVGNVTFDATAFQTAMLDTQRQILGTEQTQWLQQEMGASTATWQVLGQQVLMGRMTVPAELLVPLAALQSDPHDETKAALMQSLQQSFAELATIKGRLLQNDPTLTEEEIARVTTVLPYNLDAWDGYYIARETVLATAVQLDKNLVVLAGDSHNAWANNLNAYNSETQSADITAGVEFAVTSVTSPGIEEYLGLESETAAQQFEQLLTLLIDDLQYTNLNNRGFMLVTFTPERAECAWIYVDTIESRTYGLLEDRSHSLAVLPGAGNRTLVEV